MTTVCESQYDPGRNTVTLVAQNGFQGDRYVITLPVASREEADVKYREFVHMYRSIEENS